MKRLRVLRNHSPWLLFLIGTILLALGGTVYSIPQNLLIPTALFLLVFGINILLQASVAFQPSNNMKLIFSILLSALVIILIDFWPVQLVYSQAAAILLRFGGITPMQYFAPHIGGAQILIFVHEAVTLRVVGGEIDNACAGLIALIPCLMLLILADRKTSNGYNRIIIGIFATCIIVLGNLFRIFIELWAPAKGLAPFELVHYPLAFLLGYSGMIAITILGQRLIGTKKTP
jgi:exosortase/archaeosortase family protein